MRLVSSIVLFLITAASLQPIAAEPPRLVEAIRAHRALAQERPGDLKVLNDLGNLLVLAGEMTEAEQVYRQALDIDDELAETHYNLALLLHQTERRRQAKRELQTVLKLRPNDPWTLYQLGALYAEGGDRSRALKHYSKAFSLEPRLTMADQNPHILDNELATQALMMAHSSPPAAKLAPRKYEQPTRITELLLPQPAKRPSSAAEEPTTEDRSEAAEGETGQAASSPRHSVPTPPTGAARQRARTRVTAEPATQIQSPSRTPGATEPGPASGRAAPTPSERREAQPPSGGEAGTPAGDEERPGSFVSFPTERAPEGERRERPEGERQETPEGEPESEPEGEPEPEPEEPPGREAPGIPRHEPGEPSTGRLDLRLVPPEQDRLASVR